MGYRDAPFIGSGRNGGLSYDEWAAQLEAEMKARQRLRALQAYWRRERERRMTDRER